MSEIAAPFDATRFGSLLATQRFGRSLIFEPSVGSTMDAARDAARRGAPEGTVAMSDEQTAGRGRLGRSWETPRALNLPPSLVLRPGPRALRQLPMIAPLAVVEALRESARVEARIKWPNDVQAGGRKIAGILIETHDDGERTLAVVGAGINVNFDPTAVPELREIATSVRVMTGRAGDREALLAAYLLAFERLYDAVSRGGSARDRWRDLLVTLGRRVRATSPGTTVEGVAEDVGEDGALLVRTHDGALVTVEAGDVTLRE